MRTPHRATAAVDEAHAVGRQLQADVLEQRGGRPCTGIGHCSPQCITQHVVMLLSAEHQSLSHGTPQHHSCRQHHASCSRPTCSHTWRLVREPLNGQGGACGRRIAALALLHHLPQHVQKAAHVAHICAAGRCSAYHNTLRHWCSHCSARHAAARCRRRGLSNECCSCAARCAWCRERGGGRSGCVTSCLLHRPEAVVPPFATLADVA